MPLPCFLEGQNMCRLWGLGVFSSVLLLPKTSKIVGIKTPSNTVLWVLESKELLYFWPTGVADKFRPPH